MEEDLGHGQTVEIVDYGTFFQTVSRIHNQMFG